MKNLRDPPPRRDVFCLLEGLSEVKADEETEVSNGDCQWRLYPFRIVLMASDFSVGDARVMTAPGDVRVTKVRSAPGDCASLGCLKTITRLLSGNYWSLPHKSFGTVSAEM